jgi:hypothetical protein
VVSFLTTRVALDQIDGLAFDQLFRLAGANQVADTIAVPGYVWTDPSGPTVHSEGPWVVTMYPPRAFVVRRRDWERSVV